ncbi:MAG: decaprenyl-phosphate phosphoribosyltransferase [Candidatus Omnitrophota bacterium]|nr:decaprenyl-phosphate phosphoribosyltransferase [Candidatus Omnitrophota bacterium]MDZ4241561.1 decaprenyl-phosphate phosphoribosyltransferase [Candidatus Omnitrophota bacterium]
MLLILRLLRVKQWAKNSFIFFPLIYSGYLFHKTAALNCLLTFCGFCLISSGIYILNDFLDRDKDRLHPKKSQRPLAKLKIRGDVIGAAVLVLIASGLWVCQQVDRGVLFTAVIFIMIHLVYNYLTKHVVILDVIFIALGFQMRIWAGAYASGVLPSIWLQMCVFILALFLGFNKRRHELTTLKDVAAGHRKVLGDYSTQLLDQIIVICSTLAITFYGLYTISPDITARINNHNMVYSVTFVIYGIFRYLYLVHIRKLGDEPGEILFSDKSFMLNIIFWIAFIIVILYQ